MSFLTILMLGWILGAVYTYLSIINDKTDPFNNDDVEPYAGRLLLEILLLLMCIVWPIAIPVFRATKS